MRCQNHDHEEEKAVSHHDQHGHALGARDISDSFSRETNGLPTATSPEIINLRDQDVFELRALPVRKQIGDAVRSHRALMAEAADRLRRAEEDREREAQELSAARVIQQQLLPEEMPSIPGWRVAAYYRPAREVGGDFYDFLELPNGQVAIVAGDVTDKGIPAALVMATTHSILRGEAPGLVSPGAVLGRANDRLYPDIPAHMFATCLCAVLDPATGRLRYANAGHNPPYAATADGVAELRGRGMPLGAMPGMSYEEGEVHLAPGESVLLHSDGLVEAHNQSGEMFGFPRLRRVVENNTGGEHLIEECLTELREFAGHDWEQEDDITLVALERMPSGSAAVSAMVV